MKKQTIYRLNFLMASLLTCMAFPLEAQEQTEITDSLTTRHKVWERLDGGQTLQREYAGAISSVSVESLKKYTDLTITNGLQGRAAGLISRPGDGGIGYNSSDLYIRGLHTNGDNKAIVIIDGIERPMDDILAEEIESIEILKDAISKIIYGPAAANGVIKITTKRGEANKRVIRTSLEAGVMDVTRTPDYLNSYEYARLYNEARRNDGLPDFYQPFQLEGYKNSKGANDLLYPDVDYMDYFTRSSSLYRKAVVEFYGGNNNVKYSLVAGYTGASGLEKIGDRSDLNRFNVRGNLDIRITDYLTVKTDVAGRLENKSWGIRDGAAVYNSIATHRPNEYPLTINPSDIDLPGNDDGTPYFGASERFPENLYADMKYGGNISERYVSSQTNLGLDFDFNKFIKGLRASAYLTFDNYNYMRQQLVNVYPTYSVQPYNDENGNPQISYTLMRKLGLSKDQSISDNLVRRTTGWRANVGYETSLGLHDLSAVLAYHYFKNENKGLTQDIIDANYTLRMNYTYNKRYMIEAHLAYMGSNKFADNNKYFFSPTIGAAWILWDESFMESASGVNFLKLKASYGVLGYAGNTGYNLYQTAWYENGTTGFNEQNKTNVYITSLARYGNPDLKWEKSAEVNIGIEGAFLQNRLRGEVNYFNEKRSDIIGTMSSLYASYIGTYTHCENMGQVNNKGFDADINWNDKVGRDFSYQVGLNLTYSKNKLVAWDENSRIEAYRKAVGQPTDRIFGLQSQGLFGKDIPLAGHPFQTFGPYQNGDIAYADLNGDKVIDGRDETRIGNTFPRMIWGIDAGFQYKSWGLYLQGTAETGVDKLLTNTYYWNRGIDKYSVLTQDRYHETENPQGSYPRLTSTNGANSFRNSSFWVENSAFFRLKNVELSYTFNNLSTGCFAKKVKVFARGTNLFVLSKIKDLDPERPNAGVTNYPVYSTYTGGVTVTF